MVQEWQEVEHGVFTYYLLEGLTGKADHVNKGFVSINDLQTHVVDNLRRWSIQHRGLIQEPTFRMNGLGDMIVTNYHKEQALSSVFIPTEKAVESPPDEVTNSDISDTQSHHGADEKNLIKSSTKLTERQRRRLQQEQDIFQQQYDLLSKKLRNLRKASAIETDVAVKLKLDVQIEETEAEPNQAEQRLNQIEIQLF